MALVALHDGHNASVVVLDEGRVVFALQEERVTRRKNAAGFPHEALAFTLEHLGLAPADVEAVCFGGLASASFTDASVERFFDASSELPVGGGAVARARWKLLAAGSALPGLGPALERRRVGTFDVRPHLERHGLADTRVVRAHHHHNHAATAYFGLRRDPDERYLVLSLDGAGDGDCARVYTAARGQLELVSRTPEEASVGAIFASLTHLMGMTPLEHEYKLMGLAPYADPERARPLVERLRSYVDLAPDDPLRFERHIPEPAMRIEPRLARDFRRVRFDTLAAAIQIYTEEILLDWVRAAIRATGIRKVLAAGGVFMNVKANKLIAELDEVEEFDVFPSCGDESLPFGALWSYAAARGEEPVALETCFLGPDAAFDLEAARSEYDDRVEFRPVDDPEADAARLLAEGHVVARCSGRMEFGARALGNRSLLADPAKPRVVDEINRMIKQRDFWMPFAPAVLRERAGDYLVVPPTLPDSISPHMMHSFDTTDRRTEFPAATHPYDHTSRPCVVLKEHNLEVHRLIEEFDRLTGKAIVLNTSFNLHGFPLVMGTRDAIDVLLRSSLEHLIVGSTHIVKPV